MKKILRTRSLPLAVLTIVLMLAFAGMNAAQITVPVKKGASLPATCDPANVQTLLFFKTGASNGLYYCSATNTWLRIANTSAGYVVGPGSSTTKAVAVFDGTTGKLIKVSGVVIDDTTNAISGTQSIALSGSTSGALTIRPPPIAGTNTLTLPAGTTDLSATGGTSQVVKQTTSGGALTVAQLAASDLSNGTTGSGSVVLSTSPSLVTPALGTPTALVGTSITGTAAGLTAGNVTTNANLTGEVTSAGNAATLTNSAVIGKVITGYTSGAGTVAATDTILQAIQKLNGNNATNANLTGPITSSGNATAVAAQTGTGSTFVMQASPTLTTPTIGVATATSVNKVAITAPTTSATLTIADGKTATVNNSLTLAGTDSTTMTFPSTSATIARTDAANTFTGVQTMTSPALTTPAITGLATGSGVASAATASTLVARDGSGNFSAGTITANLTGTASNNVPLARPVVVSAATSVSPAASASGTYYRLTYAVASPILHLPPSAGCTIGTTVFYVQAANIAPMPLTIDPDGSDVIERIYLDLGGPTFSPTSDNGSPTFPVYNYVEVRYVAAGVWVIIGAYANG